MSLAPFPIAMTNRPFTRRGERHARATRRTRGQTLADMAVTLPLIAFMWCFVVDIGHVMLAKQRAAASLQAALDWAASLPDFNGGATVDKACLNMVGTNAVKGLTDATVCKSSGVVTSSDPIDDGNGGQQFSLTATFNVAAILPLRFVAPHGTTWQTPGTYPIQIVKTGRANRMLINNGS
jgi:Flp pilus assembly protein TadG